MVERGFGEKIEHPPVLAEEVVVTGEIPVTKLAKSKDKLIYSLAGFLAGMCVVLSIIGITLLIGG